VLRHSLYVAWRNCIINLSVLLRIIFMHINYILCNERNITICCKFPQLHFYQILLKLVNIWLSYSENKKGELFLKHSVDVHYTSDVAKNRYILLSSSGCTASQNDSTSLCMDSTANFWRNSRRIITMGCSDLVIVFRKLCCELATSFDVSLSHRLKFFSSND